MQVRDGEFVLSATDLSSFLGCRHRTALDMAVALGKREAAYHTDPLLELLVQRGFEHERRFVDDLRAKGKGVVDLAGIEHNVERLERTIGAMREGAGVIVQGAIADGEWNGRPDVLVRVDQPSALGGWSYEVYDTKLARETKAGTILQLSLYSQLLATSQGLSPNAFYVVTPTAGRTIEPYRVDDYAAYFRSVRDRLRLAIALGDEILAAQNYPEPVEQCEVCRWMAMCADRRRADDHLSLVAGISRVQRMELQDHGIATLTALAHAPSPLPFKPRRESVRAYDRVRSQAALQLVSRDRIVPEYELLSLEEEKGLCRLPEPSPGDLFLDLEGDPFVGEVGREYLFGIATVDGGYEGTWGLSDVDERRAFEQVIDRIVRAVDEHPDMHVYHFAPYEPAAFTRLMGRYATREREFESMLRAGRFVDLYAVVRQAMRIGVERYSIKKLEPLYAFGRAVDLDQANRSLRAMELALESSAPESASDDVRRVVEGYNRDDCVSTRDLRNWLEEVRTTRVRRGVAIARPPLDPTEGKAPEAVDERAQSVDALRARLLSGVPDSIDERSGEQQARWLLAYCLDYHRREDRVGWATHYRLCEAPEEDLYEKGEAIAGLAFVERVQVVRRKKGGKPTGSVVDRYSFPPQEIEIGAGAELYGQDKKQLGDVAAIDTVERTVDIKKGPAQADIHPTAVCAFNFVRTDAMADALMRIGAAMADDAPAYGAARTLLRGDPPRLRGAVFDDGSAEDAQGKALRVVHLLDRSVLAVQGPPGAGKTFLGAQMICSLVRQGKRVGVVATSHKVIRHLLEEVAKHADEAGTRLTLAHKCDDDEPDDGTSGIRCVSANAEARELLDKREVSVLGGTAWVWSRDDFADSVDVLFVDEAGQMSLANVVAVSQAANSVVLLGDPRQLEQPRKGSHPDGVDVSALEHLLGGHQTIPPDRGIFLPTTWRLAPSICRFTSEAFYERRLDSLPGLERQHLSGVVGLPDAGLVIVPVEHVGNRNYSPEEIDVVESLVARLTAAGATWTNRAGVDAPLRGSDVLVVAPYNAQVTRLTKRLEKVAVAAGTVDKFQGQEAPVVIYSMTTSSSDEAPRGMEFLLSLNRLNVATSRARCLAIVVASSRLLEIECRTPRQMRLANALCRFRELATPVVPR